MTTITRDEIEERLLRELEPFKIELERFMALGEADELYEPGLRDLWLIWGTTLRDA